MKYINFSIDTEGLLNNGLHIYSRTGNRLEPIECADFTITDTPLTTPQQLGCEVSGIDATPRQLHNIIFFEILKAFRR